MDDPTYGFDPEEPDPEDDECPEGGEEEDDEADPCRVEYWLTRYDVSLIHHSKPAKSVKIQSIRTWPRPLTLKQRYCLAYWIAQYRTRTRDAATARQRAMEGTVQLRSEVERQQLMNEPIPTEKVVEGRILQALMDAIKEVGEHVEATRPVRDRLNKRAVVTFTDLDTIVRTAYTHYQRACLPDTTTPHLLSDLGQGTTWATVKQELNASYLSCAVRRAVALLHNSFIPAIPLSANLDDAVNQAHRGLISAYEFVMRWNALLKAGSLHQKTSNYAHVR